MPTYKIEVLRKVRFEIMAKMCQNWGFYGLNGHWAISSPIVLNFGLPILLDRNEGQNKFELDISKNGSNMAMPPPKMGSSPRGRQP